MSVAALQERLDDLAADPSKEPSERIRELRLLKDEIADRQAADYDPDLDSLQGHADRYIADNELRRETSAHDRHIGFVAARENADLRDQMLARGHATPAELDAAGMYSHDQLDAMAGDGTLGEALVELEEFFHVQFTAELHPRNRRGEWSSKPGQLPVLKGRGGGTVAKVVKDAAGGEGASPGWKDRAEHLDRGVADAVARGAHDPPASPGTTRAVRDTGPVPDERARPNAAGKVSQKALLAYARRAVTQPTTADTFGHIGADGRRRYDESRKAEHERIISKLLDHLPSQENPTALFTGGGYAAGKGSVLKRLKREGRVPRDALTLDPDKIKAELPEFKELLGRDPEANLATYEEAWDIAQELQRRATAKKVNMVVDGLGNTSPEDMLGRADAFRKAGYSNLTGVYSTIPTDEAIRRAGKRAESSPKVESRRFIPETLMRAAHRDVAASYPGIIEGSKGDGGLDRIELWNNEEREPRLVHSFAGGHETVHDEELHRKFTDQAQETIPGVDAPARADTPAALEEVERLGLNEWPKPGEVAQRVLSGRKDTQELHTRPVPQSPGTTGEPQRAYTAARKRDVHDKIVGDDLSKAVGGVLGQDHPIAQKLKSGGVLNDNEKQTVRDAASSSRGGEKPTALFMAGGPASGKSSALAQADMRPENAVNIDPDSVKERLPEYDEMVKGGERYAAAGAHEESSDIAKRIHQEARDLGLNMIVDGTGDSKPGKFAGKMRDADANGYNVDSMYVTAPTDTAVVRAVRRAQETGRFVPVPEIRSQHSRVSQNFDEVSKLPFLRDMRVFDTSANEPRQIAHGGSAHGLAGAVAHDDDRLMQRFRGKAGEA